MSSFWKCVQWKNMKVVLAWSGKDGVCYQDFKPFNPQELFWNVSIYILHGLYQSPQVEMKFKPHCMDKVHRNDLIYNSFWPNSKRHYTHFKSLFSFQKNVIEPSPRTQLPDWKVWPLLMLVKFIFPLIWMLGVAFYIDESTMWFKGCNADKMNITYKAEGDGFQADTICQKLYIYQIFMPNDPLPKHIYLKFFHNFILGGWSF